MQSYYGIVTGPGRARNIEEMKDPNRITEEDSKSMTDQAREARRAYKREWNRKNKDKVKAAQARYWERRAQAMTAAKNQGTDEPTAEGAG